MCPVSSETTTTEASVSSDMPAAALCLIPNCGGRSRSLIGSVQRAASMRLPLTITAPSCNGEFLKNRFISRRRFTIASIRSPVSITESIDDIPGITINAPVLDSDMELQASAISFTVSPDAVELPLPPNRRLKKRLPFLPIMYFCPKCMRKRRISGWKMTMSASEPTSSMTDRSSVIIFIPNAETITLAKKIVMMAMSMFIAEVPFIDLNA